jgi:hypothetical protein
LTSTLPNKDPLELLVECLTVIGLAVEYERTVRRAVRERDMARIVEEKGEREVLDAELDVRFPFGV